MMDASVSSEQDQIDLVTDADAMKAPFYKFDESSDEFKYLKERRNNLGGSMPHRSADSQSLGIPDLSIFQEMLDGTGDRKISTTMSLSLIHI